VACGGVDDKMWVFITDGSKKNEVLSFLTKKLQINHTAFEIRDIEEIPKNDAGKTLYAVLERYYK
jgi:long-chain acyl-CoA synthetase